MIRNSSLARLAALLTLLLALSVSAQTLTPATETTPSPYAGDSLDDSTVWVHPSDPDQSVIVTTLKASNLRPVKPIGLITYDLEGNQLQFLEGGSPNNVDSRPGFPFAKSTEQIIVASHWYTNEIVIYRMDTPTKKLHQLATFPTSIEGLRGLCLAKLGDEFHAIGAGSDGLIEQYRINSPQRVELIQRWQLKSESEGCVVDDATQTLYVAEENRGIWSFDLSQPGAKATKFAKIKLFGPLKKGLEGLTILRTEGNSFLIVSVQEKSRFAIYDLSSGEYLTTFKIGKSDKIDGVSKTDGIHISPISSSYFPEGLLIVHDDSNLDAKGKRENQNFKLVPLESLLELLNQK